MKNNKPSTRGLPSDQTVVEIYQFINGKESRMRLTWPQGAPVSISVGGRRRRAA
jgi:hypothetical protein